MANLPHSRIAQSGFSGRGFQSFQPSAIWQSCNYLEYHVEPRKDNDHGKQSADHATGFEADVLGAQAGLEAAENGAGQPRIFVFTSPLGSAFLHQPEVE
jgi:hypothetical protein